jgi:tetratricopeptide (TPR) repeat protein
LRPIRKRAGSTHHPRRPIRTAASFAISWTGAKPSPITTNHCVGGPQDARTYYNRASAYRKQGKVDQAIADYPKALELSPDMVQAKEKLQELGVIQKL